MKKLVVWLVAFVAFAGSALAQDVTGTWQGTLHVGQDLRCLVQITRVDGALRGKFFSIDQPGSGMTTNTMSVQDGVMKFTLVGIEARYEGKISADGKSSVGTWTQGGGNPLPLTLDHVNADAAWQIPTQPAAMKMMPADAHPGYEVATIKPSKPDQQGKGFTLRGRHFVTLNTTVQDLIMFAYDVNPKQIVGGPDWINTEHYEMDVLPDIEGLPSIAQSGEITRKILADRFGLKFHEDKRDLNVYVLSVAKSGVKIAKSGSDPNSPPGLGFRGLGRFNARNATMKEFAGLLQSAVLDRPVVDQTNLTDRYDFQLNWTPDESQFGGRTPPPSADNGANAETFPSLYTAIQEQDGLKLDPMKAPVRVLVVDKVERPSAN